MSDLRVVIDQMVGRVPGGIGRYATELTRALIATAPPGAEVSGIVSSVTEDERAGIMGAAPGLARLHATGLRRRELSLAWQLGVGRMPGMIHAMSLLAPLGRHDRVNDPGSQVAVTIHDAVPWTHPETLTPRGVSWHRAMARRAERFADAIVVPTHAVAQQLSEILDLGDRVRVIGAAASPDLVLPVDADDRASRLGLPERYVLAVGTLEPRKGLEPLIRSLALPSSTDLPLLLIGSPGWGGVDVESIARDAGLPPDRVRALGRVDDADLAVALDRATVFVQPSLAEGFGIPLLEAFAFSTPVVHSDAPALVEVAGGAGIIVTRGDADAYGERLAEAIASVVADGDLAERLGVAGADRARSYSWRSSAEKVWQLHASL